jgi:exopolyphosphatase / guanosine-5'-triphosphate,3'-diphosphate pyrophosphatase
MIPKTDFCVIDIGSNSIRFMRVEFICGSPHFGEKSLYTAQLAEGPLASGRLDPKRMRLAADAIADFRRKACGLPVYAYATSAVRDAENRDELLSMIRESSAVPVEILSGEREGRLAYLAATGGAGTMLDIGGGSMQLVSETESVSFPIGCVRAKDYCRISSQEQLKSEIFPWASRIVGAAKPQGAPFVGVGGTITTVGMLLSGQSAYHKEALDGILITPENLCPLLESLIAMGAARQEHPLLAQRHDTIVQGGVLLLYWLLEKGMSPLSPHDADGMEGYAMQVIQDRMTKD